MAAPAAGAAGGSRLQDRIAALLEVERALRRAGDGGRDRLTDLTRTLVRGGVAPDRR